MNFPSNLEILNYIRQNPGKTSSQLRTLFEIAKKDKAAFKLRLKKLIKSNELRQNRSKQFFTIALAKDPVPLKRGKSTPKKEKLHGLIEGKIFKMRGEWKVSGKSDPKKFYPLKGKIRGLKSGQEVRFELFAGRDGQTLAKLRGQIVGRAQFAEICQDFLDRNKLRDSFKDSIYEEAQKVSAEAISVKGRKDYRDWYTLCIDPPGARDHDDAISLNHNDDGTWTLGIHIADVAHYVAEAGPMDCEALKRSFTQYLPWQAVSMLPEILSTDKCSLKQEQDRFAFSCIIELSARGILKSYEFCKTIVNVDQFLTYEESISLLEAKNPHLLNLSKLTGYLRKRREKTGLLRLNFPETRVEFNNHNEPIGIIAKNYIASQSWIEECMLLTNKCCAQFLKKHKLVGIYREHDSPDLEQLKELLQAEPSLRKDLPSSLKSIEIDPKSHVQPQIFSLYAQLIENAGDDLDMLRKILRSMSKANYGIGGLGHFALCWQDYAHFTSPIRRYADLWVHRRMSAFLAGKKEGDLSVLAGDVSDRISTNEITNMKVERQALKFCNAWLAQDRIGEEFEAKVSGMQDFGMYVAVTDPAIEGLVRFQDIEGDYFNFNPDKSIVYGKRSGKVFQMGDIVRARLIKVDITKGQIDFKVLSPKSGREA
jgi:ribonuclease R